MLFAVLFEDHTTQADEVRRQHMQAHLDFLGRNASMITDAGPLRNADGAAAGGLWLVSAETHDQVDRLVREDPFWPTGLRKSVRVLTWQQVFARGVRL
ncbi:YciI family protein [Paraburkholderia sp.]|uniref:YciI family protein n=1 Tax=Paraburkholderia sp. TaxID=1926495 RepID=UPI003D6EEEA9